MSVELYGLFGALLLGFCSIPLAVEAFIKGKTPFAVSAGSQIFLWIWWLGEIFSTIYVVGKFDADTKLLMNYGVNVFCVTVLLFYTYNPRSESE